jgi:hypothetical protein
MHNNACPFGRAFFLPACLVNVCYNFYFDRRSKPGTGFTSGSFFDQCGSQSTHFPTKILPRGSSTTAEARIDALLLELDLRARSCRTLLVRPEVRNWSHAAARRRFDANGQHRTLFGPPMAAAKVTSRVTRKVECSAPSPVAGVPTKLGNAARYRSGAAPARARGAESLHTPSATMRWERGLEE